MKDYFSNLTEQYDYQADTNIDSNIPIPSQQAPFPNIPEVDIIMSVVDITKESIKCFTEYAKCREHEKTERKRIAATLRAIEYQIDAQKEVYIKELEKQYEERNKLYDLAEKAQTKALNDRDKEMLQLCYNFILNVYNKPTSSNENVPSLIFGKINSTDSF